VLFIACVLTCGQSSTAVAQTLPPSRTANGASALDALVLSTGASRGFAHAGVLVGLDSLGYDPDIVVGTSMGAVLGALYAAGYTPAEIWRLVEAIDWGDRSSRRRT
jgi:NTE family protein